jgi:hypothetical protein
MIITNSFFDALKRGTNIIIPFAMNINIMNTQQSITYGVTARDLCPSDIQNWETLKCERPHAQGTIFYISIRGHEKIISPKIYLPHRKVKMDIACLHLLPPSCFEYLVNTIFYISIVPTITNANKNHFKHHFLHFNSFYYNKCL